MRTNPVTALMGFSPTVLAQDTSLVRACGGIQQDRLPVKIPRRHCELTNDVQPAAVAVHQGRARIVGEESPIAIPNHGPVRGARVTGHASAPPERWCAR